MNQELLQPFLDIVSKLKTEFATHFDANAIETRLQDAFNDLVVRILPPLLQEVMDDSIVFLPTLKKIAAKHGLKFCGYRKTSVRIFSGQLLSLKSPYFTKAKSKRKSGKKRKRGPNGTGCHLALNMFGFMDKTSKNLVSNVVQLAILCPSFEIAKQVLAEQSINLNVKTIQRLCERLGKGAMEKRGAISLGDPPNLKEVTALICFDGGRLRERKRKQGKKPASLKRQGYHTDWVEPKLLTIQFLDNNGNLIRQIPPLYDATLGKIDDFFELLYQYLKPLDLSKAANVVFCADGAPGMWKRVPELMNRLNITKWHESLDYTHAKQNLYEIIEWVPESLSEYKSNLFTYWKKFLWNGDWKSLRASIKTAITGKHRKKALKKFDNYFNKNCSRMRYSEFKKIGLPIGSGAVESAIRRVINLRIKGAGIFWIKKMAETMLFLRSQYLSGRWDIMLKNTIRDSRAHLLDYLQLTRDGGGLGQIP